MKIYGVVEGIKPSNEGDKLFAKVADKNKEGNYFVIYTEDVDGWGKDKIQLEVGMRLSLNAKAVSLGKNTYYAVGKVPIKVYQTNKGKVDVGLRMAIGNALNAAYLMNDGKKANEESIRKRAENIYFAVAELRENLLEEFKGVRDEIDVSSKLGAAVTRVVGNYDKVGKPLLTAIEGNFRLSIEVEESILRTIEEGKTEEGAS